MKERENKGKKRKEGNKEINKECKRSQFRRLTSSGMSQYAAVADDSTCPHILS